MVGLQWLPSIIYSVLSSQLLPTLYRRVLVSLHSSVMPHLLDPRLLIDFLINSYDAGVYEVCVGRGRRKGLILRMYFPSVNAGGVISLLALNGLFILMHEYHL